MPPRRSTRDPPKSSPASTKSTPRAKPNSTPVGRSSSRAASATEAKSSPYFQEPRSTAATPTKGKGKGTVKAEAKSAGKGKGKPAQKSQLGKNGPRGRGIAAARDEDEDEEDDDEPTGMTETEDDSDSDSDDSGSDAFRPSSEDEEEEVVDDDDEEDEEDEDSDDIDGEDFKPGRKRKNTGQGKAGGAKKGRTSGSMGAGGKAGKAGKAGKGGYEDDDDDEDEIELEDGQEIAGRIYPAPTTGQAPNTVPPGQISRNTFKFLANLQVPERNDRDWFRSHEPAFRQAEKEWQAFVGRVQSRIHEADNEVPILPPKDIIHRIYRDVRFSSDKTPYKKSFSLSTSRGGRKGIWAGYHLSISPNGKSIMACGTWMPGKNELATIRHHLHTEPEVFRATIGHPDFVRLFGPAKPHPQGKRQNVFGHDDALKVAPKGVDKDHKDIDLLKLRSVAVVHHFDDDEVLSEDFMDKVQEVATVMAPFVHMMNDFLTLPDDEENGDEEDDDDE